MQSLDWLEVLRRDRVVVVIRAASPELAYKMASVAAEQGFYLLEITWNTPQADQVIDQLRHGFPDRWVGAGTILNPSMAHAAIQCGSQFLFSPAHDRAVIEVAQTQQIPIVAGALTPAEILTAWQRGANAVKVFPIHSLGGATYLKALKPVLPDIPLIPTGGVGLADILPLIDAGAVGLGMSGYLFPGSSQGAENWTTIEQRMIAVLDRVKSLR